MNTHTSLRLTIFNINLPNLIRNRSRRNNTMTTTRPHLIRRHHLTLLRTSQIRSQLTLRTFRPHLSRLPFKTISRRQRTNSIKLNHSRIRRYNRNNNQVSRPLIRIRISSLHTILSLVTHSLRHNKVITHHSRLTGTNQSNSIHTLTRISRKGIINLRRKLRPQRTRTQLSFEGHTKDLTHRNVNGNNSIIKHQSTTSTSSISRPLIHGTHSLNNRLHNNLIMLTRLIKRTNIKVNTSRHIHSLKRLLRIQTRNIYPRHTIRARHRKHNVNRQIPRNHQHLPQRHTPQRINSHPQSRRQRTRTNFHRRLLNNGSHNLNIRHIRSHLSRSRINTTHSRTISLLNVDRPRLIRHSNTRPQVIRIQTSKNNPIHQTRHPHSPTQTPILHYNHIRHPTRRPHALTIRIRSPQFRTMVNLHSNNQKGHINFRSVHPHRHVTRISHLSHLKLNRIRRIIITLLQPITISVTTTALVTKPTRRIILTRTGTLSLHTRHAIRSRSTITNHNTSHNGNKKRQRNKRNKAFKGTRRPTL